MVPSVLTTAAYRSSRCAAAFVRIRINCHGKRIFLFGRIILQAAPEDGSESGISRHILVGEFLRLLASSRIWLRRASRFRYKSLAKYSLSSSSDPADSCPVPEGWRRFATKNRSVNSPRVRIFPGHLSIRPDLPCHRPMEHGRAPPFDSAALRPELHSTQIAARLPESHQ